VGYNSVANNIGLSSFV